ncbi:MAG: outer membrane protein assembly factor BamA [Thermodesulfobacteriota bacterium]|nr:outer membrane protein assembly factor BamA [Thermodesulfobacteriota bacterium]
MLKKIIFVLSVSVFVFSPCVSAGTSPRIGVFPFTINADKDLNNYSTRIAEVMADAFEKRGADVVVIEDMDSSILVNRENIKNLGVDRQIDWFIRGNLFALGNRISIDTELTKAFSPMEPVSVYKEIQNEEAVFSAVHEIIKKLSGEVFSRKIISEIEVSGNKRIEPYAVLNNIDVKTGDFLDPKALSENLKKVYEMGYFEDVRILREQTDQGVKLVFQVQEKPSVRKIKISGNNIFEDDEISEVIGTNTGSILNIFNLNKDVQRIKTLYTEKNYHNSKVSYKTEMLDHNQADLVFMIEENEKLKIETILIDGNKNISDKEIQKIIKTDERGFFSWITSSGDLDKNELQQDVYRIEALYKNRGFMDARVSEPEIDYQEKGIIVTFKIDEGDQFKIRDIKFTGDLLFSREALMERIVLDRSELFNRDQLRKDILTLSDAYADKGFAKARIVPEINRDVESKQVDITFDMKKGSPVYIERIIISGNTKTRDKVIRRQLKVYEQQLYSKTGIQQGVRNLTRTDYFENVDVSTTDGSKENTLNLNVEITEKATGAFSFGGGYSSEESIFGMVSISERNLFGRGQTLALKAEISGYANRYTLSFTEPWLFDIPLSAGFDLYNWETEYDYYDKESRGAAVRFGYMILDYTYLWFKYGFEDFEITNVDDDYTDVDPGTYVTSSVTTSLSYDSRNSRINPTRGMDHRISVEYAGQGLGGEIDFIKYIAETGWYFPLFWKFTGFLHAKTGYLDDKSDRDIEIDYERFYLGGMNSVRGFDWQDINASDSDEIEIRGGEKMIQFNAELIFPLFEEVGLTGVVFYDAGDVYADSEDIQIQDLYSSYGAGFRWQSPMGPIRIEYGFILEGKEYDSGEGRWEFSMGGAF